jgi:hypothetical protein
MASNARHRESITVEQSAKSSYKPIVLGPATAAKIFEALSGAELRSLFW